MFQRNLWLFTDKNFCVKGIYCGFQIDILKAV